jgi:signal peptidase I
MSGSATDIPVESVPKSGWLRTPLELAICLIILVTVFRSFLAGGYMIETGSMAPCLLGYHWQGHCPVCGYSFAIEGSRTGSRAFCPNCEFADVSLQGAARNDGDHLLVHRSAYALHAPRRWEVVVFQNPARPTQAYVKRLTALPGETVQIRHGDLYINGEIQAKSFSTQQGMRIIVYDDDFRPTDDADWEPRWVPQDNRAGLRTEWKGGDGIYHFQGALDPEEPHDGVNQQSESVAAPSDASWMRYRHWVRAGGRHATSVPLEQWPANMAPLEQGIGSLFYDDAKRLLICRGAMSRTVRDELKHQTRSGTFHRTIDKLYEASHIAPITDTYGYNRGYDRGGENEVRDLMLGLNVAVTRGEGRFLMRLHDGTEEFETVFDFAAQRAELRRVRTGETLHSAQLPAAFQKSGSRVEFSLWDHQVILAVNGAPVWPAWSYPEPEQRGPTPWQPAQFGVARLDVEVSHVQVYRDVYYTAGDGRRAITEPLTLRSSEYFVLGDNSPVSRDSRSWDHDTLLSADMFLGKPLVVHLPSRRVRLEFAGRQTEVRIPEFSRIRYIR